MTREERLLNEGVESLVEGLGPILNQFEARSLDGGLDKVGEHLWRIASLHQEWMAREAGTGGAVERLSSYLDDNLCAFDENVLAFLQDCAKALDAAADTDFADTEFDPGGSAKRGTRRAGDLGLVLGALWAAAAMLDIGKQRYVAVYIYYVCFQALASWPALGKLLAPQLQRVEDMLQRYVVRRGDTVGLWPWASPLQILPERLTIDSLATDTAEDEEYQQQALDPSTPMPLLRLLAEHHSARVREAAATNPLAPTDLLTALTNDREPPVRLAAAHHWALPAELLERLHRAGSKPDLSTFARFDQGLDPAVLEGISRDGYWGRVLAAWHPNTSCETLMRLATSKLCVDTRMLVAANPSTPADLLARLAGDLTDAVRRTAARNPHTSEDALAVTRQLGANRDLTGFAEPDPTITEAELRAVLQSASLGPWVDLLVARHPNAGSSVLAEVPLHNTQVANVVINHPATPRVKLAEAISLLALDTDPDVRSMAAEHPLMPGPYLELLIRAGSSPDLKCLARYDTSLRRADLEALLPAGTMLPNLVNDALFWWARVLLARHPNTPEEHLSLLAGDEEAGFHEVTDSQYGLVWDELIVQAQVAANGACPPDALRKLARSRHAAVRESVAQNPSTPGDVLQDLALDLDTLVRDAVTDREVK